MADEPIDYYEALQISPNADHDTIQRVFRMLAQRYHPDNAETGNPDRFREVHAAYVVLSDPEKRASYDAGYQGLRQQRWRLAAAGPPADTDYDDERHTRMLVLQILYTRRRMEPSNPGVSNAELIQLLGKAREHLEFTFWYLAQRKLVTRTDQSDLIITADGVDFLEEHEAQFDRPRLRAANA